MDPHTTFCPNPDCPANRTAERHLPLPAGRPGPSDSPSPATSATAPCLGLPDGHDLQLLHPPSILGFGRRHAPDARHLRWHHLSCLVGRRPLTRQGSAFSKTVAQREKDALQGPPSPSREPMPRSRLLSAYVPPDDRYTLKFCQSTRSLSFVCGYPQ